ncbi:MAG: hypothetical protein GY772_32215 [bacterium]|nr:hypothetical protein [bacterium]
MRTSSKRSARTPSLWQRAYQSIRSFARHVDLWGVDPEFRRRYAARGWTRYCKEAVVHPYDPDTVFPEPVIPDRWVRLRRATDLWQCLPDKCSSEYREEVKMRIVAMLSGADGTAERLRRGA